MQNTDTDDFVEQMGIFFDQLGVSSVAGRLFAVLLVCEPAERSAKDLAESVGASAGSVNAMLRLLMGLGLVSRRGATGSKRYLYQIQPGAWSGLLKARLSMVGRLKELAELGIRSVGDGPEQQERLVAMRDFYAFFEKEMSALIERYVSSRRPAKRLE